MHIPFLNEIRPASAGRGAHAPRTHGTLRCDGFQDRSIKPLSYPSALLPGKLLLPPLQILRSP